jgi:CheY-like chemotaxis protein
MSDDLIALKILVVSDSAAEQGALRSAASQASVMVEVAEADPAGGAASVCERLASVDVVFLDCRMPQECRCAIVDAARAAAARPIVISLGAIDLAANEIAAERLPVDGLLTKPVALADASALLNACVRARLPSRVLVVDDSSTVRSVVRKVLQSCRYRFEVVEAGDGASALACAGKQHFDLVLLDHDMPGLDGFATLTMLLHSYPRSKVVVVTATNNTKAADRARAAGAYGVLYKPFYAKDVDAVMSRLYGLMRG